MEKMQILFPKPQLDRLRWIADVREVAPKYSCGAILTRAEDLRDSAYTDRAHP